MRAVPASDLLLTELPNGISKPTRVYAARSFFDVDKTEYYYEPFLERAIDVCTEDLGRLASK